MFNSDTDRDWEKYGKNDPYFSVLTDDKFRKSNLSDEHIKDFFKSGQDYVHNILDKIKVNIDPDFTIKKALDFGCGVGRLIIPLADVANEVTGVDVSDSMLKEAKKNCEEREISNVVFVNTNDSLSSLKGKYNFIHSVIVFQHIPVKRGEQIFENLIAHLENEGICVVHFTYAQNFKTNKIISLSKRYIPFAKNFINLVKGRSFNAFQPQMNPYDLNHIFLTIQKTNVRDCYIEFTNHVDNLGVIVYFKKPKMTL